MAKNIYEKIWEQHVIANSPGEPNMIYIDLHLVHEVTSPQAFSGLKTRGIQVRRPDRTFMTVDHAIPTINPDVIDDPLAKEMVEELRSNSKDFKIQMFDRNSGKQGIVHVIGPELGLTQPGYTIVCGDSHTSTHGAFGALAFGIGTSEVEQVLATQCLLQNKSKTIEIRVDGKLNKGVSAKDIILYIINKIGVEGGAGKVIEYTGSAIHSLSMEERMTICNMSIEGGARAGIVSPDQITIDYLRDKEFSPKGKDFDAAAKKWMEYASDPGCSYDQIFTFQAEDIKPRVTYGTNPAMSIAVDETIPTVDSFTNESDKNLFEKAVAYMGITPGAKIVGTKINAVFIGSCTNSRISDLRAAAGVIKGKQVMTGIKAYIVPGSQQVKLQAEQEGIDKVFKEAGFDWREPGCSSCLAMNADKIAPGQYCVATSNRNFEGRQGKGARTILASPVTAAISAITGEITDIRKYI